MVSHNSDGDKCLCLPRLRTLDECVALLKSLDEQTAVSKFFIRNLALNGTIPSVKSGNKRLINFDALVQYLNRGDICACDSAAKTNGIRKII